MNLNYLNNKTRVQECRLYKSSMLVSNGIQIINYWEKMFAYIAVNIFFGAVNYTS